MIPAAVRLRAADSVDDAVAALGRGRRRRQGAGRRAVPAAAAAAAAGRTRPCWSTSAGSSELRGVREDGDALVIGAMTTHHDVHARPAGRRSTARCWPQATGTVGRPGGPAPGHLRRRRSRTPTRPATCRRWRSRWTPSSSSQGPDGRRTVPARGVLRRLPADRAVSRTRCWSRSGCRSSAPGWGVRYEKFHRVAQAWAIVGVAAAVRRDNGSIAEARVGLTNMGPTPCGPARPSRRWPARRRRRRRPGRPSWPPTAPSRRATCPRRPTTASTWPGCSPRGPCAGRAG